MFEGMEGVTEIEQAGTWGEGVLILFMGDNVMIKVPKKSCLSWGRSKASLNVLAHVQHQAGSSG